MIIRIYDHPDINVRLNLSSNLLKVNYLKNAEKMKHFIIYLSVTS